PVGVFAVPLAPSGSVLNQGMYAWQPGVAGGALAASPTVPRTGTNVPFVAADHAAKNKAVRTRK
ncbi:MAG TPA: hypothetical protein VF898_10240, partial [Chloroflexota bacterium]